MDTKKTKTLLIVILLAVNIFFIYNVISLNVNTVSIPAEAIQDAANVLSANGFIVSPAQIPDRHVSNFIFEGSYERGSFEEIVRAITGAEMVTPLPLPERRISYIAGDFRFDFGDIETEYDNFRFTIEIIDPLYRRGISVPTDISARIKSLEEYGIRAGNAELREAERIITSFIYPASRDNRGLKISAYSSNGKITEITAFQTVDGLRIDSHDIYIIISEGEVVFVTGKWYFNSIESQYRMPLLDSVNILFRALESDGGFITSGVRFIGMELIYSLVWHEPSRFYLIPSWELSFSDGTRLVYNTLTGDRV